MISMGLMEDYNMKNLKWFVIMIAACAVLGVIGATWAREYQKRYGGFAIAQPYTITPSQEGRPATTTNFIGSILPQIDALYDVGSSTKRWRNAYFSGDGIFGGTITVAGCTGCGGGSGGGEGLGQTINQGSTATTTPTFFGGANFGGVLTATGTAVLPSGTTINSQNVCLADGTNCIATGGLDPRFVYNATLDAMRPATNSTDFWVGGTASTTYITDSSVSSTNAVHISVTSSQMWMNIPAGPGRPFRIQEGGVDAIRMGTLTGSTNGLIWCGNNVECYLRYGGNNSGESINIQGDLGDDNTGLIENAAFAWGSAVQPITSIGTTTGTTFGTTFGKSAQKFLVNDGHIYPNQHQKWDLGSTNTEFMVLYAEKASTTEMETRFSTTTFATATNLYVGGAGTRTFPLVVQAQPGSGDPQVLELFNSNTGASGLAGIYFHNGTTGRLIGDGGTMFYSGASDALFISNQETASGGRIHLRSGGTSGPIWEMTGSSTLHLINSGGNIGSPNFKLASVNSVGGTFTHVSSTNVTSTSIDASLAIRLNGQNVCLADGTNCPSGVAGSAPELTFYPTGTFGPYLATTTGVGVSSTIAYFERSTSTKFEFNGATGTGVLVARVLGTTNEGSVSAPALRGSDPDTGFYFNFASNQILGTTNGVNFLTMGAGTLNLSMASPQVGFIDSTGGDNDFYIAVNNDVWNLLGDDGVTSYLQISDSASTVTFPFGATSSRAFAAPYIIATSTFRMLGTSTSTFAGPASSTLLVVSSIEENTAALAYVCADAQGKIYKDSTLACVTSNPNQKDNIQPLKMGLSTIMALEPIEFDWKPGQARTGHSMGFNAVQAAEVDERLIARDENGEVKGFRYMEFTAALTKGIQELAYKNDEQDDRLNALEAENLKLHEEIIKLNQRLESLIK